MVEIYVVKKNRNSLRDRVRGFFGRSRDREGGKKIIFLVPVSGNTKRDAETILEIIRIFSVGVKNREA